MLTGSSSCGQDWLAHTHLQNAPPSAHATFQLCLWYSWNRVTASLSEALGKEGGCFGKYMGKAGNYFFETCSIPAFNMELKLALSLVCVLLIASWFLSLCICECIVGHHLWELRT